ncbi:sensor histidine kinase [Streptomyces sp. MN03-5084-2B]|nr:sensor histidine kinase [Streptomyces sp. MN03-5084-2B]
MSDDALGHPLLTRAIRIRRRLRQTGRARPWLLDTVVVAVVVVLFCVPEFVQFDDDGDPWSSAFTQLPVPATLALQAGLVLPLLGRRRAPSAAFAAIAAVFVVQWSLGVFLRADVALLVALYSVALHGRVRHVPWVGLATAALIVPMVVRVSTEVSVGGALFFLICAVTAAAALGFAVRVRRAQLAALRERAARLEVERDQRSRLATATERTRVAREMHDIVGHHLSVIISLADGGAYAAEATPERSRDALRLVGESGRQALGELRRMLGVLREQAAAPELHPQPRIADIEALCGRLRAAGPEVVHRSGGDLESLDRGVQLMAYRIVQEALTNALKHAGPGTRVHVTLTVDGTQLRICVEDTGPPGGSRPAHGEGHGLTGMRERAALYGGTLSAGPAPGGGWTVQAVLDVTPHPGSPA